MKSQQANNRQANVSQKVMVNQNPSFSLTEEDVTVHNVLPLQIRSGVRSGDEESCEAEGGNWKCGRGGCWCADVGTGDWD